MCISKEELSMVIKEIQKHNQLLEDYISIVKEMIVNQATIDCSIREIYQILINNSNEQNKNINN